MRVDTECGYVAGDTVAGFRHELRNHALPIATEFQIEALASAHDRSCFTSGSETVDRYLRQQPSQDVRRRAATCFVAVSAGKRPIAGYYTLSAAGVALDAVSHEVARKAPRYPVVPTALLDDLPRRKISKAKGSGALLADALLRTSRSELGVFAILVEAKDECARRFYEHFGFKVLIGHDRRLLPPIAAALLQIETKQPRGKK